MGIAGGPKDVEPCAMAKAVGVDISALHDSDSRFKAQDPLAIQKNEIIRCHSVEIGPWQ